MPLEITHMLTIFVERGMIADIPRWCTKVLPHCLITSESKYLLSRQNQRRL